MSALLTQVDVDPRVRPLDRAAADELCRGLPRDDPMAAQQALCEALARPTPAGGTDAARLATLLAVDGVARRVCGRLLDRYVEGDGELRALERRVFVSVSRLSQSMVQAYDRLLQHVGATETPDQIQHAANVIVRLLAFRQVEYLLRMFRYKRRNGNQWQELHGLYRFAMERGLHGRAVATVGSEPVPGTATTVEQQYIQILLLEGMNSGQLSPREALWACRWSARWSRSLSLRPHKVGAGAPNEEAGFSIDLASADGPTRKTIQPNDGVLYLDTGPLLAILDEAQTSALDSVVAPNGPIESTRHAELALLDKLKILLAPVLAHIERRGERTPIVSTVHVVAGLPHIVHTLRRAALGPARQGPAAAPLAESTIEAYGGPTRTQTLVVWNAAEFAPGTIPEIWQVRDRSDSGCRMRGKTADLNRVVPGSLLAIRASESAPWTLTVVRRLRRLMVDHVEIGVEYVGQKPRFVKIVMDNGLDSPAGPRQGDPKCIGAIYLPPSDEYPAMPIRTLVLPARDFRSDRDLTLLSSNAIYTLRLNEPIRCEVDFVWTSFTLVKKAGAELRGVRSAGR